MSKFPPDDFCVTPEMLAWAGKKGLTIDIETETEKFLDHEFKRGYSDWRRCWQNWMRTAQQWETKHGKSYFDTLAEIAHGS